MGKQKFIFIGDLEMEDKCEILWKDDCKKLEKTLDIDFFSKKEFFSSEKRAALMFAYYQEGHVKYFTFNVGGKNTQGVREVKKGVADSDSVIFRWNNLDDNEKKEMISYFPSIFW